MFTTTNSLLKKLVNITLVSVGAFVLFFCILNPVGVSAEEALEETSVPATIEATTEEVLPNLSEIKDESPEVASTTEEISTTSPEQPEVETVEAEIIQNELEGEKQSTDYSCGPAALVTWIKLLGGEATESELKELAQTNPEEGTTFLNLRTAARAKGFEKATVYRLDYSQLSKLPLPALLFVNGDEETIGHYVVLSKIENGMYYVIDPLDGQERVKTLEELQNEFGNYALIKEDLVFEEQAINAPISSIVDTSVQQTENETITNTEASVSATTSKTISVATDEELFKISGKGAPIVGLLIASFLRNPRVWVTVGASVSKITQGAHRGGINIEKIFYNPQLGQYLYQHQIITRFGNNVHNHFRGYPKW